MKRIATFLRISSLGLLAGLYACSATRPPVTEPGGLQIYVLQEKAQCEVRGKTMACTDVGNHIIKVLNVKPDSAFTISARGSPPYESFAALVEGMGRAGFKFGTVTATFKTNSQE
jgi:hypothetical protein